MTQPFSSSKLPKFCSKTLKSCSLLETPINQPAFLLAKETATIQDNINARATGLLTPWCLHQLFCNSKRCRKATASAKSLLCMEIKPQKYLPTGLQSARLPACSRCSTWTCPRVLGLFQDTHMPAAERQPKSVKFMNGLQNKFKTATPRLRTRVRRRTEIGGKSLKPAFRRTTAAAKSFGLVSRTPQKKSHKRQGKRVQPATENEFSVLPTFCGPVVVAKNGGKAEKL